MQVMNFGAELRTMTSREIAELTGKGQQWLTRRLIDLGYLKPIAA